MSYIFIQIPAVSKNDPKPRKLKSERLYTVQYTVCTVAKGAACCGAETSCTVWWRCTLQPIPPPNFVLYCREIQNVLLCTVRFIIVTLLCFFSCCKTKEELVFWSKGAWLQSHWMMGCRRGYTSRFYSLRHSWISGLDGDNPSSCCIRKRCHWLREISI